MSYFFKDIIGNERIKRYLQEIIKNNKIPHAFIIEGPPGIGKKMLAKTFAKTLQCKKENIEPCGECVSCKTFDSGNNTDVFYINAKEKKSIGVNEVREEINSIINIKPFQHKYKIFIIEDAGVLTQQAQNALLKTIEEPPPYGKIILTVTGEDLLLPTILSRCIILKLRPLNKFQVKNYLMEKENVDEKNAEMYASLSGGSIGRGLALFKDKEFLELSDKVTFILRELRKDDLVGIFNLVKSFEEHKSQVNEILDIIFLWYRDILIYKETNSLEHIFNKDDSEMLKEHALEYSINSLYNNLDAINYAKMALTHNSNFQSTMEVMLLKIKGY